MRLRFLINIIVVVIVVLFHCNRAAAGEAAGSGTSYFQRFFVDGGPIVWFVLGPLSLATMSLIVQNFLVIRRVNLMGTGTQGRLQRFFPGGDLGQLRQELARENNLLAGTLFAGLARVRDGATAMENAIYDSLEQQSTALLRKIEWLNIIGNVAPMIGLFGTVWGMIEAFNRIVKAQGQPEPDQLAGAISIALVTTLWGLFTAIPALAAYGSLRNRIDALAAEIVVTAENFLENLSSTHQSEKP
ncbi:MAG: MotA/TolQ/ExbB proton channel family protein [Sedimentisphaerales bacterium]|nr:MotA/TolQ/ExbB proton channel family protein [Sedimentisphaerales bacterium]